MAAVDAEDKLTAYRNWLGIIRGDLSESFEGWEDTHPRTGGRCSYTDGEGDKHALSGRSLMFVRNVGHLMTNPAMLWTATRYPRAF